MEKERKAIVPVLRQMEVGTEERFPLEQYNSVTRTIYGAGLLMERAKGMKWSCKTDMQAMSVIVTRVS